MPLGETSAARRKIQKLKSYHKNKPNSEKKQPVQPLTETGRKQVYRRKQQEKEEKADARKKANRDRQRKHRENKCSNMVSLDISSHTPESMPPYEYDFKHRSTKSRALKRLRTSLPKSPRMRLATLKSYIKEGRSPTARYLKKETQQTTLLHEAVVNDLREAVQACKSKRNKDSLTAMNVIVASVSGSHIAKAKCMKRLSDELELPLRRITGGKRIRTKILKSEKACWTEMLRKTRNDSTDEETKLKCYNYWLSEGISRPTGNKKDIKRQRLGPKMYSSHMIHVLEKSQTEVYLQFKREHTEVKMSQRQFEKYKPYFVRPVREQDRQTCCCRQHVEIGLLYKKCKEYRNKMHGELNELETLTGAVDATLCEEQHPACINRQCIDCGVNRLALFPDEIDTSGPDVCWEKYQYVKVNVKQKVQSKLMLVKQSTSPGVMFGYFRELLSTFSAHRHRAVWQRKQLNSLVENLPRGDCICVHDFSENYRCSEKQELQTTYFQKTEVTLHITLLYRHAVLEYDGIESMPSSPTIITETIYSVSPDQHHDNIFVKEVQQRVAQHLQDINYDGVNTIHEFTDGCAAQYRSRHCFDDLSSACETLGCRSVIRNYFETSHAKGPQDAAGGFLKRHADLSVLRGGIIQNARDLYEFGSANLKENKTTATNKRLFWYIPEIERSQRTDVKPVVGIRSVRQVKTDSRNGTLKYRHLSCYACENCLSNNEPCENADITGPYETVVFNSSLDGSDDIEYIEEESRLLAPGMIIAGVADDPLMEYYVMEVRKPTFKLQKDCTDVWGSSFTRGSYVISGLYFDMVDGNPLHLKKLKGKQAMVHKEAYIYTCADIGSQCVLHLPEEIHLNILARIQELVGAV